MALDEITTSLSVMEGQVEEDSDARELEALGHKQEMSRNYSTLSLAAMGFVTGNAWSALGGSILVAIYNGGPTGVLYEMIAVSAAYGLITLSLAELASSVPSSGGVYHWSTVLAGPKYGRITGFFAGWFNFLAWVFATSSTCAILGNALVEMYLVGHPDVEWKAWMVFVAFQVLNWIGCLIVSCGNKFLPALNVMGSFVVCAGVLISIVTLAVMPKTHATSEFVWSTFINETGWSSSGLVFIMGLLNGAYAIGTVDCTTHLAEEVRNPGVAVPKAMFFQLGLGFATAFAYMIALSYAISDLNTILSIQSNFPITAIYQQATGSTAGAIGLTFVIFLAYFTALPDTIIASGRMFWALARDNATPFSSYFAHVSKRWGSPIRANILCSVVTTAIGCIYVGNTTAFNAFVGSFVVLTTISYGIAIGAHMSTGRKSVLPGPFHLGRFGWIINILSLAYIVGSNVMFCFPFVQPVTQANMNYVSVIVVGFFTFIILWWVFRAKRDYEGPKYIPHIIQGRAVDSPTTSGPTNDGEKKLATLALEPPVHNYAV
ncbi:hypothetical protein CNMCM5793_000900 [Aspergillus hiratsukae]|uniref:Choline transport protein n=1 Tax=Aspergillus hiratsukae TaxID=1194566 RepID=A0A8H6PAA9_9EURO|nr:hypothetical protein CNMCM5793_000900 [Aspergillus hiratsukae]